ncbi:MAG: alkaline phosphatase D family protein [Planctomycetota bacterium]
MHALAIAPPLTAVPLIAAALLAAALVGACAAPTNSFGFEDVEVDATTLPSRIAFGSCADQDRPQPALERVVERDPDLFVYLGDNVYGDTEDMDVLRGKYETLAARPEFQSLRAHCPTLAIWDDHDYGANDAGKEYPQKEASREVFLDFWGVPMDSPRREHAGIYHDHVFESGGRTLQVILLDTRTFRDALVRNGDAPVPPHKNDYRPNLDPTATILGEAQWAWLGERLAVPADLRIVATSIQFGHSYNGWESWTNVPHERDRLIDLVAETRANGVVFVSGDVHWGEISRQPVEGGYDLWDVTASGINQDWDVIEPNVRRFGPAVAEHNFGMIEIDWFREDPSVELLSVDVTGAVRNRVPLAVSDLRFP